MFTSGHPAIRVPLGSAIAHSEGLLLLEDAQTSPHGIP